MSQCGLKKTTLDLSQGVVVEMSTLVNDDAQTEQRRVGHPRGTWKTVLLFTWLLISVAPLAAGEQSPVKQSLAPKGELSGELSSKMAPPPEALIAERPRLRRPTNLDAAEQKGRTFRVSSLKPEYVWNRSGNLSPGQMLDVTVPLKRGPNGYDVTSEPAEAELVNLKELNKLQEQRFTLAALQRMLEAVVAKFHEQGIFGVYVGANADDISPEGLDLRAVDNQALRLAVRVPVLGELHTVAQGDRVSTEERVDHPLHERIRTESPVGVGGFIMKDQLENFVHYLNRHPGRQVHMTVAPSAEGKEGEAKVDYVVSEGRQWNLFAHVANTGTKATSEWRETFGFRHNQLTNNDDILILNYTTASFSKSHAIHGTYEIPFPWWPKLRVKGGVYFSSYRATDLGIFSMEFKGHNFEAMGEGIVNVYQQGPHFLDLFVGGRWQNINVKKLDDLGGSDEGREDFSLFYFGLRAERLTDNGNTTAEFRGEGNWNLIGSADRERLEKLGRMDVERSWFVGSLELTHSCYMDQWFGSEHRAHMIEFLIRGQHAFGDRLVPQHLFTLGGQNSVRGYPEAFCSGDSGIMGSVEYRFYFPRLLSPENGESKIMGRTFRWAPVHPGGRADWDLALSTYCDFGWTVNHSRKVSYEKNCTLVGVGVGAELIILTHLRVRGDLAWAMHEACASMREVEVGDMRGMISAAVIY